MAQQMSTNKMSKSMPRIDIDCLKSMERYLKKSKTYFEVQQNQFASITKGNVSLKVFANNDDVIITKLSNVENGNKSHKFQINSIPKQYHNLYWFLLKMVQKIRKKTIKYTIIRKRELDPTDNIICLISLSGSYTIHFKHGAIAYLNKKHADIKLIKNGKTKTLPFKYRDSQYAVHYNDAYDTLRTIVHELIRCADIVEKQKLKQLDYAKTWTIKWNADTGSVEDIKETATSNQYKQFEKQPEGLFKCQYESETTLSSDYNDTNSEITNSDKHIIKKELKHDDNKSISTVHEASYSSVNSIKSEASWRQNTMRKNDNNIIDRNDKNERSQYLKVKTWTKEDVCCWLNKNNYSKDICAIFWNYTIDGNALINLSPNVLYQLFETMESVNNQEKKRLIVSIKELISNLYV